MKRFACFLCLVSFWVIGCAPKELPSVNIFVTADIEGVFWSRTEPRHGNEVTGGLAVLKTFLDKQTTPFLLLEGGNWFAQTPEGTLSQGNYFNELTATIAYAGRLFTEKDLMYGWGSLSHILKDSPAPFILSNVTLTNGNLPAGAKSWLLTKVGDYKIGVIGLVSPQALKGRQRLGGLKIADPIKTAEPLIAQLRERGAQAIVVMSALGSAEDKQAVTERELAEEVSGIDVIISAGVGGENAETTRVGKTWIIYPGSRLDSVGRVQLSFNKNNELADIQFEDVVLYRRDFDEDASIAQAAEQLRQTTRNQMVRSVGKSEQEMVGRLDGESALGSWAADCLRTWAKADAAVLNASSLRGVLPKGTVTQYDLYNLYPYSDNVTYLTIKGAALLQALEEGLSVPDNFAQISGLRIRYNPDAPTGKRITAVRVNGTPIAPWVTYRVAVTDYMLSGGAGHDGFIDSLEFKNTQVEMRTVLRLCLAGKKAATAPQPGRWSISK
ncbi:MAG: bifunctional metallophosphatase/5'-nucleotidase [Elusimicrobiaceae bacterium]|nr:bifunctional metallophosphatase/5'-nucleotidase [Elusimicrobiaceae bacterium]